MRQFVGMALGLVIGLGVGAPRASAQILASGDNEIFYRNFENLFDASGTLKSPAETPVAGDHYAGIFNVQFISSGGADHWTEIVDGQLSGVFAQQVLDVTSDPISGIVHLTLGNPSLTSFTNGAGDTWNSGLQPGEMLRFYVEHPVGTLFETNGTMADDVAKARDGLFFASFGLDASQGAGGDALFGSADDTGYMYRHPIVDIVRTEGEAFGALDLVFNNTGHSDFLRINDPFESEIGGSWLGNHLVFSSAFGVNPDGESPWLMHSIDPARISPVPEPSSLWLLMVGFGGVGLAVRKRSGKPGGDA